MRRLRRALILCAGAVAIAVARDGFAQQTTQEATGPATEALNRTEPLHLDPTQASLRLQSFYNSSTIKPSDGSPRTKDHDTAVLELLGLSTHGYVQDPSVIDFDVAGTFGLEQRWEKINGVNDNGNDFLYDYNVAATVLRDSSAPLTLSAARTIEFDNQPFSETFQSTTNTYDATWNIRSPKYPTYFRFLHNDVTQDSLSGIDDFRSNQNAAQWHTDVIFSPASRLAWDYNYSSVDQTNALGEKSSFDVNTLGLVHSYEFGPALKNSLTSTVNYTNQVGDFAQERLLVDENLQLHHSDRLETFYQYQFEHTIYPEVDTSLNRLQAGFRDKVFDGLQANGKVGGLTMDQSGAGTDEVFANLDFDYSRKLLDGLLSGQVQLVSDRQYNQAQMTEAHVVTTRAFGPSQQIVLAYQGIKTDSVAIRSASGTDIYADGLDFSTTYEPNRVIIQRIPDGTIPPDTPLLIDYDVDPRPANTTTTNSMNAGLRYDFERGWGRGLSLYVNYFVQDQDIDSNQPGAFIADDVNALTYGAEYHLWRLRFKAEHTNYDSSLAPFRSDLIGARYEDRILHDLRLTADATQVVTHFEDDDNKSTALTLSGAAEYRLSPSLRARASIAYLNLDDDLSGGANGLEEQFALKWVDGDTTVKGSVRHSDLQTDTEDTSFLFFMLSIERRF